MRKPLLITLAAVIALSLLLPTLAVSASQDHVKLKVFVHYPKDARPGSQGTCDPTSTNPSGFGTTGWVLPGPVVYHVNYSTIPSTVSNAQAAIAKSFGAWKVGNISFSEGSTTTARGYKYDGQNVVVWGSVPSGAIAVTYTWYNSAGVAVECDTVMGKSLPWKYTAVSNPDSTCADLSSYDVQNILTHEVGHWMGLNDLYGAADHDLTMYGYGDKGELKKDTLANGDNAGLNALY